MRLKLSLGDEMSGKQCHSTDDDTSHCSSEAATSVIDVDDSADILPETAPAPFNIILASNHTIISSAALFVRKVLICSVEFI